MRWLILNAFGRLFPLLDCVPHGLHLRTTSFMWLTFFQAVVAAEVSHRLRVVQHSHWALVDQMLHHLSLFFSFGGCILTNSAILAAVTQVTCGTVASILLTGPRFLIVHCAICSSQLDFIELLLRQPRCWSWNLLSV